MEIKKIEISNFKSYATIETFEFSTGLNLISGHVGSGKSCLFDAFFWVMYEKTPSHASTSKYSFVSEKIRNDYVVSKNIEPLKCSVKLTVIENKIEYLISRTIEIQLDGAFKNWSVKDSDFTISYKEEKTRNFIQKSESEAIEQRDLLFPKSISKYMWFQGEALSDLIDFSKAETFENAVTYISYLPVFEKMKLIAASVFKKTESKLNNKVKAGTRDLNAFNKMNGDIEKAERILEKSEKEVKELTEKKARLFKEENEIIAKLTILANFPELKLEEQKIESEINAINKVIASYDQIEKNNFTEKWMLKGASGLLNQTKVELNKFISWRLSQITENQKQLAEGVPGDEVILKLIADKICLCDSIIGDKEKNALEKHLDKNKEKKLLDPKIEDLHELVMELKSKPDRILRKIMNITEEIKSHKIEIDKSISKRNTLSSDLANCREKITEFITNAGIEIEGLNAQNVANTRTIIKDSLETCGNQLTFHSGQVTTCKSQIRELKNDIKGLKPSNIVSYPEEKALNHIKYIQKLIEGKCKEEKGILISKIEESANEIQRKIIEGAHENIVLMLVKVDRNDFSLTFTDRDGNPNPSHGAQRVLAKMSIITAILKLSNEYKEKSYPFITDAPTSDFDADLTKQFLSSVSDSFQQSIIILKDAIRDLDFYKTQKNVNSIYVLTKKYDGPNSTITNSYTNLSKIK
jgi:DNA sulfur modification protein DndD